ncbi:MAG: anti-sigma factor family protein, partial [Pyrinomonadaceae bacterium]
MICSDIQSSLPLYADGFEDNKIKAHLEACPLCRQQYSEFRDLRIGLQKMRRPEISVALRNTIKLNVQTETQRSAWPPLAPDIREWLMMRLMPYGVGVLASVAIGVTFLTALFSGAFNPPTSPIAMRSDQSMMLASNRNSLADYEILISPSEYAQTRLAFANESPSINPQGALIAMTRSLAGSVKKNDEFVVVADVYSNGSAQIAEVVEPSSNSRAVAQLEKALYT